MSQKTLTTILIIAVIVLGAAVFFMLGQNTAAPGPQLPDDSQNGSTTQTPTSTPVPNPQPTPTPTPTPPPLTPGVQGAACKSNSNCASGLYCAKTGGAACSAATTGTCQTRPEVCIKIYSPVCGCDGKTYGNSCEAGSAGMNISSQGACN